MKYCVYIYRDPKKDVPIYVGKGTCKRPYIHLGTSHNPKLNSTLRKREREGYDIRPIIIEAPSETHAIEMEMLLIALIGREDLGLGSLFNLTDGGDGMSGYRRTEEQKQHQSRVLKAFYEDPTNRQAACERQLKRWQNATPEAEKAHSSTMRAFHSTPEGQAIRKAVGEKNSKNKVMAKKISEKLIAYNQTEEGRQKKVAASNARWAKPGAKERAREITCASWEKRRKLKT